MPEIWAQTAAQLAAAIRGGSLSAAETVHAHLNRIAELEPRLHAWEALDGDRALAAARDWDARRAAGETLPGLVGVPVGVKDIIATRGVPTTMGSPLYARHVPDHDAAVVERLRAAGAIVVGKTVTTQFAFMDPPPTVNPWSAAHTPGGSSSGAAAAVAARMVPASLGSQTGGSVVRPASFCGAVGLKPSFGRVSRRGVYPAAWSLDTVGVLTRTVEDAALFLTAMAGHDPLDRMSSAEKVEDYLAALHQSRPPRLALLRDYLDRAAPRMREHLQDVARRAEAAGARVVEARLPLELDLALAAHHVTMQAETAANHAFQHGQHADAYAPRIRGYVEAGLLIPAAAYVHAQRVRRRLREGVDALLADVDALLLPTANDQPPPPDTTGDLAFQAVFTLLGMPAITLPTGLSDERVPFGSQLVGRRFREAALLGVARWMEQTLGVIGHPPV